MYRACSASPETEMKGGGWWEWCEEYKPAMAMIVVQMSLAAMTLFNRAALVQGTNPRVFIFYRQSIAALAIVPFTLFSARKRGKKISMGLGSFLLIFFLSLVGVVLNQNMYFEGLYLSSSSIASAMSNLVPAITFLFAALFGLEKINIRSQSTAAKILGTIICVGGAISIALLKGPKLLNANLHQPNSLTLRLGAEPDYTWLLGCLFLFANSCCSSFWLILQVPASVGCPDHLSMSAWMCLLSTLQAGVVALLFDRDPQAWRFSSPLELTCVLFSGIVGSGLQYIMQAWVINRRGPLYSAMFNPLCTVIVTVFAFIFLHEQVFVGSLLGSAAVIVGLYTVLWGKSKDMKESPNIVEEGIVSDSMEVQNSSKNDLEQPLLRETK